MELTLSVDGVDIDEDDDDLLLNPTSGGRQMTNDNTHTPNTRSLARFVDIMLGYVTGRVTATYLSSEIAQRFRMDAVHIQTSSANQIWHQSSPKIQTLKKRRRIFIFLFVWKS